MIIVEISGPIDHKNSILFLEKLIVCELVNLIVSSRFSPHKILFSENFITKIAIAPAL